MADTVTVEIKSRWTGSVLFAAEVSVDVEGKFRVRAALTMAVKARANLVDANLAGANLSYANLAYAKLAGANLSGANLAYAKLAGANLSYANLAYANLAYAKLAGANLAYANLAGANLAYANLAGAKLAYANLADANLADANLAGAKLSASLTLVGKRPFFFIGPIGSVSRVFHAYITNDGLRLRAGCFFGTRDEFVAQLADTHDDNVHAQEYTAALALIDLHVALWAPKADESLES